MDLYFSPLACSMATRIALYEAGQQANFIEVDPRTKKVLKDNSDFYAINALGLVPVVRTDDGVILTENAAILQHVAAMAVLHRHRAAQGPVHAAARQGRAGRGEVVHAGKISLAARPSRQASQGPRVPARPFQRGGCVSDHRAELEHGDAHDRLRQISGGEGLSGTDEEASGGSESARGRVRALQGRDRASQAGSVSRYKIAPAFRGGD